MEELINYFKDVHNIKNVYLNNLSKYEIKLLMNAINNIDVDILPNDVLSGTFYNCLGIIMREKKMSNDAKKHYLTAIEKGDTNAMNNLGHYYYKVKKNYNKAKKYYLMAVRQGNSIAMNNLGNYYCDIKKNMDKAKKCYSMAIKQDDLNAMTNLGNYHYHFENYDKAKKYYLMAIEQGNSNAMNSLGIYYEQIKKNYDKAEKYFLMAVKKGNSNAMCNLGCHYCNVRKNYSETKKYLLMAINKNNTDAMNNLGHYYNLINKNYGKAVKYYYAAIKNGNVESYHDFENCVKKCHNYESFINCHINLIKNENFTFIDKLNKFVNEYFYNCLNFIEENIDILQKYLNIPRNVKSIGKNHCVNCSKYMFLVESNCNHNTCFACYKMSAKCLLCKKIDSLSY